MIQPPDIPRLPVFDWQGLGTGMAKDVQSVVDDSEYVFTSSGRAAIMLGLEVLGIGKGDRVMVPTYHCPTMVSPIIAVGAEPVFYPINEKGEAALEHLVETDISGVKAVIVPHFFGIPQDMSHTRAFCDQRGIALIEDCAHCFFGREGTHAVGQWGDIAIASLTKFFPVPAGGILAFPQGTSRKPLLHSPGLVRELKAIFDVLETASVYGRIWGLGTILRGIFSLKRRARKQGANTALTARISDVIVPEALDFDIISAHRAPERICRWMPSIIDHQRLVERRRTNYLKLASALSDHRGFSPLFPMLPENAVPYVFPLHVEQPDNKYSMLKRLGLPVYRWNWLWPGTPAIVSDFGLDWSSEVFQLACHQDLTDDELECICSNVIRICSAPAGG